MNQYLMTKSVYIRSISKHLDSLKEEVTKKNNDLNVRNKHQNIAARTFLDVVITSSNYNEDQYDKYIKTYEPFVEKNNVNTKNQHEYGMNQIQELEKIIAKKQEQIMALNNRDEIHEKREILWGKYTSSKSNKFDQDAYILENDLENLQELIKTTDSNQFNEIQNYQVTFENSFASWLNLMEDWFKTLNNN